MFFGNKQRILFFIYWLTLLLSTSLHADAHAIEAMCIPQNTSGTDTWCASRLAVARSALQTAEAGNDFSVCNDVTAIWHEHQISDMKGTFFT